MRRKKAMGLLLFSLLCLAVLIGRRVVKEWKDSRVPVPYEERILGIPVVAETDFLEGKEKKVSTQNPGVVCEGVLLPYDRQGILYFPQTMDFEWTGKLSASGKSCFLCMPNDSYWERKQDALRENHAFTLWLVGEDYYYELELICSGTPVISIHTDRSEEPEEVDYEVDPDKKFFGSETLYYGTMEVFEPGIHTDSYEILESYVCYHEKGGMTGGHEKKSYSFNVQDHQEKNRDVSLLGMRLDNTWKLNALVTDPNRIREITASQIWEQFDEADPELEEPGPQMEYVELILDNGYQGLYCLVEPVDEKKLELDRNDVLYKIIGNFPIEDEDIQYAVDKKWKMYGAVRIRYPKDITDYAITWFPIRDYFNTFYAGASVENPQAAEKVNLDNLADNFMFLMAATASDNSFKNTYYAAKVREPGSYVMYRIPWDLDLTFGNLFDADAPGMARYEEDYTLVYEVEEFSRLVDVDPQNVGMRLRERWNTYRQDFLSTDHLKRLLTDNRDYLVDSGAILREQERWPGEEISTEIDYLLDYQTKRMEWLDEYFGE